MSRFVLRGGERLSGELTAQGAKNSVLPILAATILSRGVCVLHRCPGSGMWRSRWRSCAT